MARDTGPQCKQCRREGQKLFLEGRALHDREVRRRAPLLPAGRARPRPRARLRVPQPAAREAEGAPLLRRAREAVRAATTRRPRARPGVTGENLLRLLERRFDNVLVRLGFAASRRQARQLVNHGHWLVNGRRVDIPSYQVRPDDVITIRPDSGAADVVRQATELTAAVPPWLQADHDALTAKVLRLPERSEITAPVQEQLIVELYSK